MASFHEIIKQLPQVSRDKIKVSKRNGSRDRIASDAHWNADQALMAQVQILDARKREHERNYRLTGDLDSKQWAEQTAAEVAETREELREHRERKPKGSAFIDEGELAKWANKHRQVKWRERTIVVKLPKGQTATAYLTNAREQVNAARRALKLIETAPLTADEAVAQATSCIKAIAANGAPDLRDLSRLLPSPDGRQRQGNINWPQTHTRDGDWFNDGFALFVWTMQDVVTAKIASEIQRTAKPDALSATERPHKISEAKARLLELERLEEAAFLLASEENPSLERRRGLDFQALLQIEPTPADELEFG